MLGRPAAHALAFTWSANLCHAARLNDSTGRAPARNESLVSRTIIVLAVSPTSTQFAAAVAGIAGRPPPRRHVAFHCSAAFKMGVSRDASRDSASPRTRLNATWCLCTSR